jgi:hypothetical protein
MLDAIPAVWKIADNVYLSGIVGYQRHSGCNSTKQPISPKIISIFLTSSSNRIIIFLVAHSSAEVQQANPPFYQRVLSQTLYLSHHLIKTDVREASKDQMVDGPCHWLTLAFWPLKGHLLHCSSSSS